MLGTAADDHLGTMRLRDLYPEQRHASGTQDQHRVAGADPARSTSPNQVVRPATGKVQACRSSDDAGAPTSHASAMTTYSASTPG